MNTDQRGKAIKGKENLKDLYPLTPMQEGMLFHSLYDERPGTYLEQVSCSITGDFNVELFEKSWNELFKQHDILRTIFIPQKAARPLQMVLKECQINFQYQDIQHLGKQQQSEFLDNYQREDIQKGFNLERDVLMRVAVFQTQFERYEILWTHHHILMDGWSSSLVLSQLIEIYKVLVDGQTPNPSPVPPYSHFIQWLKQQNTEAAKQYWQQYLQGYDYPVRMPKSSFLEEGYQSSTYSFQLDEQTTEKLKHLARKFQVTLSSLIQSIWAILLAKYHDVDDVVFGSTVSGRPSEIKQIEQMVGLFINTIPVRFRVEPYLTFVQLIERVHKDAIKSKEYTYYSLADIQALSEHRSHLIDHVFVFQNYPEPDQVRDALNTKNYKFNVEAFKPIEQSNYDFSVIVIPGERLKFRFLHNAKVFSTTSLQRIESQLCQIVQTVLLAPETPIGDIQIISDRDRQLISEFNQTNFGFDKEKTIVDLIEAQVNLTPDATAVRFRNKNLSYRELSAKSDTFADFLSAKNLVQPGDVIAIMVEPSERFAIAVLAVMKARCGFLALDPKAPIERNRAILKESGAKAVIIDTTVNVNINTSSIFAIKYEDSDRHIIVSNIYPVSPQDLAYIIFTSGSTGKPKGIAVKHSSLFNYIYWCLKFYFKGRDLGNMPLFTSPAFDLTITSIFCPLACGKTVAIVDREEIDQTLKQIFDLGDQIDTIKLTPSHISALKHLKVNQTAIQIAIVGGEELNKEQIETLQALNPNIEIYNEYGPTEATVGCIAGRAKPDWITIGKPIANTRIYIFNKNLLPVPIGCVGEIYIAGLCLADGYWQDPPLTAASFITHPLEPKSKLYRSGDLGKWLENGEIIFLGRKDDQVKLRGYRLELGEIETLLKQHPAIDDAVAVVSESKNLQAYLIPNALHHLSNQGNSLDTLVESISSFLSKQLPEYMIPKSFEFVDRFPLTYNGKLDKKALLKATGLLRKQNKTDEFKNHLEKTLAEIWQDLLGINGVGVDDDFFALGGHSLNALVLLSRIRKTLKVEIPLKSVFDFSTIRALGDYISALQISRTGQGKQQMTLFNPKSHKYIFALPTMFGYGIAFKGLAQYLKSYSVYSLDFIEDEDPITSYAELLEETQPQSPYFLLGYCVGGNLAFELAKKLEHRGHQVSDIIMLDSAVRKCKRNESDATIQQQVDTEIAYYSEFVKDDPDLSILLSPEFQAQLKAKTTAYIRYLNNKVNDGQIKANVHLIWSTDPNNIDSWVNMTAGNVFVYKGSGNHGDMLTGEHLQHNALLTNEILDRIFQNQQT